MKIGFFCESPADQATMAVFTEGILGEKPEPINLDLRARGVTNVINMLDGVFRGVHFNSDAEGLVVVVDCDETELHNPDHDKPGQAVDTCRLCQIRTIIVKTRSRIRARPGTPELKVAIGLAVPAIEAWYLVGRNHQVGEAACRVGLAAHRLPLTKAQLKKSVYGTDRPSLELATKRAEAEARRIIGDLTAIETAFPAGFGLMAREIRSWSAHLPQPAAE